jgi:cytochrome b subunit of formate dehydrogenase
MFYSYPQSGGIAGININSLEPIAVIHTAGAFMLVAFIVVHLYLITTGTTLTSNLKAMLTGYEELEEDKPSAEIKNKVNEPVIVELTKKEI